MIRIVILSLVLAVSACGDNHKNTTQNTNLNSKEWQDKLVEANKMYVKRENDEIDQYVKRHQWAMQTTGTGLRYMITKRGEGTELAKPLQHAKVDYKVSLMDGTVCYSSEKDGPRTFVVAKDNIETGLHEGIQLLHLGDEAVFILPSHLAHGLTGDGSKIPAKATVIYEIKLLDLNN